MKPDPLILIIDNDRAVRRLVRAVLAPQGYRVIEAENAETGLSKAVECRPDVIILEVALPNESGARFLETLREWSRTPVLVLSERKDDNDKVSALDAGASDYLTKPFSSAELLARLRVLQRPLANVPDGPLLIEGNLVANLATHETSLSGHSLHLTPKEAALFYVLAHYCGRVVTRSHLLRSVWGIHSDDKIHDLQVLISRLRKKLGCYGGEMLISAEGTLGYCLLLSSQRQCAARVASPADAPKEQVAAAQNQPG